MLVRVVVLSLICIVSMTLLAQMTDHAADIARKNAEFDAQVKKICSEHNDWTETQCVDSALNGHIRNDEGPQRYVLAHTETPPEKLVEFDCSRCSAMTDLLFVAAEHECGNAGCNFYVFKMNEASYRFLTNVFVNHGGFQFLETKHHGFNDILFYHHISAEEGLLGVYEFDGKNYHEDAAKDEIIPSSDFQRIKPEPVTQIYFSKDSKRIR